MEREGGKREAGVDRGAEQVPCREDRCGQGRSGREHVRRQEERSEPDHAAANSTFYRTRTNPRKFIGFGDGGPQPPHAAAAKAGAEIVHRRTPVTSTLHREG